MRDLGSFQVVCYFEGCFGDFWSSGLLEEVVRPSRVAMFLLVWGFAAYEVLVLCVFVVGFCGACVMLDSMVGNWGTRFQGVGLEDGGGGVAVEGVLYFINYFIWAVVRI